jgi:type IX secretion system PorP/SprF family membrane protein
MKRIIIISVIIIGALTFKSQQIALNSQYLFNDFAINPAVAGSKSYAPLSFSFRRQWMGIDEAPVTQNLMYHTYFGEKMGLGAHIYNDASGPTRRSGLSSTFAYNIKTSRRTKLSFGISASMTQFSIDRDRLITEVPGDIAVLNSENQLITDCNFGLYWSGERHFVGISGFNLFENKVNFLALTTPINNPMERVMYLNGGYNFKIGAIIEVQPSAVVRLIANDLFQVDGNLKFTVKNIYSLAMSYRNQDALSFMGAVNLGTASIGYAYDLGVSDLNTYNSGTHEIFVSYKLKKDDKTKTPWKNRNKVYSSNSSEN